MKTLMTTECGVEISESAKVVICFESKEQMVFGQALKTDAYIQVLKRLSFESEEGYYGVLDAGSWQVQMSVLDAENLHNLLPDVKFFDERIHSAQLAGNGGAV